METWTGTKALDARGIYRSFALAALSAIALVSLTAGCAVDGSAAEGSASWDAAVVYDDSASGSFSTVSATKPAIPADASKSAVFAPLTADGKTVAEVEPIRYLGKWYEIATIPIVFQLLCKGSTAEYAYVDASTISVRNECRLGTLGGPRYAVNGYARIVEATTNARLSVSFGRAPTSFGAPYWVIELDGSGKNGPYEKYEWAIVGAPSKNTLWILSRTPQLDEQRLAALLERLAERGYDLDRLKFTEQPKS